MLPVSRLFQLLPLFRSTRILPGLVNEVSYGAARRCQTSFDSGSSDSKFKASAERLATLKEPRREIKMQLYALFKQATVGQCNEARPQAVDFDSHAKWDAWNQLQNMSMEEAKKQYIELVDSVAAGSGLFRPLFSKVTDRRAVADDEWSDEIRVNKKGHVLYIRFNRPAKKNALTLRMYDEIAMIMENAAEDKNVYLVVFTGTGDYFSSGNDLNNLTNIDPNRIEAQTREIKSIIKNFVQSFIDFPKPLIALVNGPAIGIAVSLLGLFDAVYAVDTATFHTPFMQLGQCPTGCSSYIFPRIMGSAKAGEMLLFNKKLTARGALERNLVNQLFSREVFRREAEALINTFATLPPQGLQNAKMLLRKSEREKLHQVNTEECNSLLDRWKSEESWKTVLTEINNRTGSKLDDV